METMTVKIELTDKEVMNLFMLVAGKEGFETITKKLQYAGNVINSMAMCKQFGSPITQEDYDRMIG